MVKNYQPNSKEKAPTIKLFPYSGGGFLAIFFGAKWVKRARTGC